MKEGEMARSTFQDQERDLMLNGFAGHTSKLRHPCKVEPLENLKHGLIALSKDFPGGRVQQELVEDKIGDRASHQRQ